MLGRLPDAGRSALLVQRLEDMDDYDLYDVLAELGYGLAPRTRVERAEAFAYKHAAWLQACPRRRRPRSRRWPGNLPAPARTVWKTRKSFKYPKSSAPADWTRSKLSANRLDILRETKGRMFAA